MPKSFVAASWVRMVSMVHPAHAALFQFTQSCVASSRAPATFQRYGGPWQRFVQWCQQFNYVSLPALPMTVAMFLADVLRRCACLNQGYGVVRMANAAIFQAHKLANFHHVTDHPVVVSVRDCAKRVLANGFLNRKASVQGCLCCCRRAHFELPRYNSQLQVTAGYFHYGLLCWVPPLQ